MPSGYVFKILYAIRENVYFTSILRPFFMRLGRLKIRSRVGVIPLTKIPNIDNIANFNQQVSPSQSTKKSDSRFCENRFLQYLVGFQSKDNSSAYLYWMISFDAVSTYAASRCIESTILCLVASPKTSTILSNTSLSSSLKCA